MRIVELKRGSDGLRHRGSIPAFQVGETAYIYLDFSGDMVEGASISSITTAEIEDSATNITLDSSAEKIDGQKIRLQATAASAGNCTIRVKAAYYDGSAVEADCPIKVVTA